MPRVLQHDDENFLTELVHNAPVPTASLIRGVMESVCRRRSHPGQAGAIARIERLIAEQAWAELALALIELELPQWRLRRLAYDGGEWHCALSRRRELPDWLDQAIETSHPDLPGALMVAFVEALKSEEPWGRPSVPRTPRDTAACATFCCDNFA